MDMGAVFESYWAAEWAKDVAGDIESGKAYSANDIKFLSRWVWEAMGQMLHHSIELKKKLNALRGNPPANIPVLLEVYQNAVRHALRVLDDDDATQAQQDMATGAEVQACQDILDVFNNLTRRKFDE